MQTAMEAPFVSPRIAARFQEAAQTFLKATNDSAAAHKVLQYLQDAESDQQYATGGRNVCVRRLATDVEKTLGMRATILFRTPGPLHNALQTLMDAYEDAMDGIYYL